MGFSDIASRTATTDTPIEVVAPDNVDSSPGHGMFEPTLSQVPCLETHPAVASAAQPPTEGKQAHN